MMSTMLHLHDFYNPDNSTPFSPQVNYFKDHTKLIVGGERQFIVTYINSERQSRSWSLPDLARRGALPQVGFRFEKS